MKAIFKILLITIAVLSLCGCSEFSDNVIENSLPQEEEEKKEPTAAEKLLSEMTLDEKICQLFFVSPEELTLTEEAVTEADETVASALDTYPVGGIIYFSQNLEARNQIKNMIKGIDKLSKTPLFMGIDEEGGRVARLGNNPDLGTTAFPPMAEIGATGDTEKAYDTAATIGGDISKLGFNVDFAPDADIITNPNNTEIGDRSFSSDPQICSSMVSAFVRGLQDKNISACAKHFPGHGSTENNSHTGYSESPRTLEELRATEFLPFKAAIAADVDFIMVSHMTAVNIDSLPCSVSEKVISLLRDELGYNNIIITDAQNMGAITDMYTSGVAALDAIKAGADMVLMPENLSDACERIEFAVNVGEITEERIDESVLRILNIKEKRGLLD